MGLKQSQSMHDLFFFYTTTIIWIILCDELASFMT